MVINFWKNIPFNYGRNTTLQLNHNCDAQDTMMANSKSNFVQFILGFLGFTRPIYKNVQNKEF